MQIMQGVVNSREIIFFSDESILKTSAAQVVNAVVFLQLPHKNLHME